MTRRTTIIAIISISLMCCFDTITAAATGYLYEHPISPFNSPSFSTLPSTGPFNGIPFGSKVVQTSTRPRVTIPPLPSLPPLKSLLTTQTTKLQSTTYPRAQPSPTTYTRPYQQQQQQQQQRSQIQQRQQQPTLFQRAQQPQQQQPVQKQFPQSQLPLKTNNQPQQQYPSTFQQRIAPQSSPRPATLRPTPRPTQIQTQRPTPRPVSTTTPRAVVSQRPPASTYASPQTNIPKRPNPFTVPTTVVSPIVSISNPNQAGIPSDGLLTTGDFYVLNGRQLKQYKVYEEIDNDIDQQVENFIPANFFVNSYHAKIGPTHPLGEDFQLQSRFSSQRDLQSNQPRQRVQQQQQQQQVANTIALGSGGLGFVKLPNGNVYLGSGSLGYISNLQRNQDVVNARTRTGALRPDAVHFGHGPLSDSFYYH